jgi:hypothetical protein
MPTCADVRDGDDVNSVALFGSARRAVWLWRLLAAMSPSACDGVFATARTGCGADMGKGPSSRL